MRARLEERVDHRAVERIELVGRLSVRRAQGPSKTSSTNGLIEGLPRRAQFQIEGLRLEQRRVHFAAVVRDPQRKFGLGENIALEIDAGRDLGDRHAFALEPHDTTLGHVDDLLSLRDRARAGEGDLLDGVDELLDLAFLRIETAPSARRVLRRR